MSSANGWEGVKVTYLHGQKNNEKEEEVKADASQ